MCLTPSHWHCRCGIRWGRWPEPSSLTSTNLLFIHILSAGCSTQSVPVVVVRLSLRSASYRSLVNPALFELAAGTNCRSSECPKPIISCHSQANHFCCFFSSCGLSTKVHVGFQCACIVLPCLITLCVCLLDPNATIETTWVPLEASKGIPCNPVEAIATRMCSSIGAHSVKLDIPSRPKLAYLLQSFAFEYGRGFRAKVELPVSATNFRGNRYSSLMPSGC